MKKARIMLIAIAVIAITGAIAAFKTKTYFGPICYSDAIAPNANAQLQGQGVCPLFAITSLTNVDVPVLEYATLVEGAEETADCHAANIICPANTTIPELP